MKPLFIAILFFCSQVHTLVVDPFLTPTYRDGNFCCGTGSGPGPFPDTGSCCFKITKVLRAVDFTATGQKGSPTIRTYYITQPGTYLFGEAIDYQGSAGNESAIQILVDGVTIDLNGYMFRGISSFAQTAVHIAPSIKGIIIRNGDIQSFTTAALNTTATSSTPNKKIQAISLNFINNGIGIRLQNAYQVNLAYIGVTGSTQKAIQLDSITSGSLTQSSVSDNALGVYGVALQNFSITSTSLAQNGIVQAHPGALTILNSTAVQCQCVTISGNIVHDVTPLDAYAGLYVDTTSGLLCTQCFIENNTNNSAIAGIFVRNSSQVNISQSTINKNISQNVTDYGIRLINSPQMVIAGNTIGYQAVGISDAAISSTATILNNKMLYNNVAFAVTYSGQTGVDIVGLQALQPGDFVPLQSKTESQNIVIR